MLRDCTLRAFRRLAATTPNVAMGVSAIVFAVVLNVRLAAVFGTVLLALVNPAHAQVRLPEIGDPSRGSLSLGEEQALGEAFLREIRAHLPLLSDPEVLSYIRTMGDTLVSAARDVEQAQNFRFYVVDSPTVNAFAGPGGIIAVNSGLITLTRNEGELASVVAHEIAHVTQRHVARAIEDQDRSNPFAIAGILAALVLATQNAEAGQAAVASVIAGSIQKRLDFTRQNELEADRVGIELLANAGYDPRAMPTFFERLQQSNRYYTEPPEFLSTHPVTVNRVADTRSRAERYPYRQREDGLDYLLVKAKVKALSSLDPEKTRDEFASSLKNQLYRKESAARYGLATSLLRLKRWQEAKVHIDWLYGKHPERTGILAAKATIARKTGEPAAAEKIYRDTLRVYTNDAMMTHEYGEFLIEQRRSHEAVALLEAYSRSRRPQAKTYELLSRSLAATNRPLEANVALAEHYYAVGDLSAAIHQIGIALRERATDEYAAERAVARKEEFERERRLRSQRN